MPIQAQLADGRVLEFPDGTDTAVIESTVQRLIAGQQPVGTVGLTETPNWRKFRQDVESSPISPEEKRAVLADAERNRIIDPVWKYQAPKPTKLDYSKQQQVNEPVDYTAAATSMEGAQIEPRPAPEPARKPEEVSALEQLRRSFVEVGIPTATAGFTGLNVAAQQAQIAKTADRLKELEAAGKGESREAAGLRKTLEFYTKRQETYFKNLAEKQVQLSKAPVYKGVRELTEAKTFEDGFKAFVKDPVNIVANLTAQSLPSVVPALVLGVINPTLGAAAMGGSSFGVEFGNDLLEFARDKGIDTTDPKQMAEFFANKELLKQGVERAGLKAGIVGAGDMLLAGLASKTLVPKRITGPVAKNVTNVATQMGAQAVGGGGVEALAQYATTGEIKPGEVLAEAFGEFGGAPAEVIAQTAQARRQAQMAEEARARAEAGEEVEPAAKVAEPTEPPVSPTASAPVSEDADTERRIQQALRDLEKTARIAPEGEPSGLEAPETVQAEAQREKEPAAAVTPEALAEAAVKPAAEIDTFAVQEEAKPALVEEPSAIQTEIPRQAVVEVPLNKLKLSEDVPQFKAGADRAGIVEPLGGKFERTGVAPIQVWRRANGDMEVISGRHRFDLAKRSGETTIPAQIHDEGRGFTRDMAAVLDAELNIRDGQGKVKDYVNYFKGTGLDQDTAESRGLLARAPGKRAFTIATKGSDELVTNLRADQIPDEAAYLIALNAPNDARLQGVGIKAVQEGKSAATAVNMMQAVRALAGEADTTTDMFGFDESAMKEAEEMAKIAGRKQKEIQTRLNAITGAAKNPAVARAEGIDIRDPDAVAQRITQLRQMKSSWDNWSTNPDLIAEIRAERGVEPPVLKPYTAEEAVTKTAQEEAIRREETAVPAEVPAPEEFVLTGSKRAADEAAARGQKELDEGEEGPVLESIEPQQREANFKRWSRNAPFVRAKDALSYDFQDGKPFVAESYHGTNAEEDFTEFDIELGGIQTAAESAAMGIFSTSEPEVGGSYAANIGMGRYLGIGLNGVPELKNDPEANRLQKAVDDARARYGDALRSAAKETADEIAKRLGPKASTLSDEALMRLGTTMWQTSDFPGADNRISRVEAAEKEISAAERKLSDYIFAHEAAKLPQRIMPLYVRMSNPKVYDAEGKTPGDFPLSERIAAAKKAGHDGVVFKNIADPSPVAVHYVNFNRNDIKSATGNLGTFGPEANISLDISTGRSEAGNTSTRSPSVKRKVRTLNNQRKAGKLTDEQFAEKVDAALEADEAAKDRKPIPERARGADFIRQKLLEAKRRGEISEEAADFAEWFIRQNERLVDDLGIAIRTPKVPGTAGFYAPFQRIMTLMKEAAGDQTAVHEILHHLERMMPADVQQAIRKAWLRGLAAEQKKATKDADRLFFALLDNHHFGSGDIADVDFARASLVIRQMMQRGELDSDKGKSMKAAIKLLRNGVVPMEFYQYVNPSEFWAVNASDIMKGRFDAVRGGVLARLKNWLKEFAEKAKDLFGMRSDAPLIRALDSLMKGDGKFVSKDLLAEGKDFFSIEPQQPQRPSGAVVNKGPSQTGVKRQRDSWMVARDEVGRLSFGPGAKAYDAVANVANAVLDKVAMKPISNELGRSIRNMKAEVNKVQNQIVGVAKELEKLSPQEREMISDVIEGELKAGVHPPQHVLNIAASMQEIMTRQSQELVRLGMLSPEAARRWENKYLPRFYMNKLRDDVTAWAKAAKRLMMRQPMMRGVKGDQLKARGIFETIYTDQLQEWLDAGWEQRDPSFDPEKSEQTVVWRDYTREERENMGEIRDAMFRFVMGYNASQRDVALGRLYENLADNYASRTPMDGYVQVPDTKVPGTMAARYGKLAGLYVPREIMDHLSHNDESIAEGVLKMYRAGLSKWKEGKTVLNPVAHANNVLSNLTMAHFAGVSYWDGHKYAGAVKDIVTNDDMLKEAKDIGLFMGTFNQAELVESMPPQLRAMANMTESQIAKLGDRLWDTLTFTVSYGGKKYGARPIMQWMYENEDLFFRYLIYRDARNRGLDPEDAREYSQQFIFTYDDLPKGARILRDYGMPFFSYTYKIVPVIARTALEYPWRFAAPATAVYAANAVMYSIASGLGGDEDDWWAKTLYRYATDEEFRKKVKEFEEEERKKLPPWMKGKTALGTEKAIRLGMDEVTDMPLFLDMSRIFPGGDLFDAESNAGGVALLQPLTPSNPVLTTFVAMLANKDMFFGKDITKASDTDAEKAQKRAAWLWKQWTPAISVGNYHFDRGMNVIANVTQKPITIDAGPMGVVSYTGVGKDGLPVQPKYAAMQTMGIKVRPYDLEVSEAIEQSKQNALIKEIAIEISRINRLERKGAISGEAADIMRDRLQEKRQLLREGLTVEGEEKK